MKTILDNGSARRFLAFLAVLVVICLSGVLGIGNDALTAATTLALGYMSQGAVTSVMHAKTKAKAAAELAAPKVDVPEGQ